MAAWSGARRHPVIAHLGLQTGTLVGGSIITETIFSWPGVGQLTIQSIFTRHVVVVEAAVLVMALAIVQSNLVAHIVNAAAVGDGRDASDRTVTAARISRSSCVRSSSLLSISGSPSWAGTAPRSRPSPS